MRPLRSRLLDNPQPGFIHGVTLFAAEPPTSVEEVRVRPGCNIMVPCRRRFVASMFVLFAMVAVACASDDIIVSSEGEPVSLRDLYDPTEAGEDAPDNYRESLPRDAINPVYAPTFVTPDQVDWPGSDLVIGVDIDGESRAYPVGFLRHREMVIDNHRGIPTLVTW